MVKNKKVMRTICGTILVAAVASAARADRIDDIMSKMTLREKIGQCVQIELAKIPIGSGEETAAWFAKYPIGSVFMGKDLAAITEGAVGNAESLSRCAAVTKIPLAVAGDLGPVTMPASLPGNGAMGALDDLAAAREYGRLVGRLGRANGYNWVFAPCVDIAINWMNPIMACRTMGDDAEKVAALSVEIVKGMQEYGLSASAKHYPGDGAGECIWTMINTDFHKPIPVTFGYPYLLQDSPWLETLVNVHSGPSRIAQETVVRLLYGEIPFQGKSPFDLSVYMGEQL